MKSNSSELADPVPHRIDSNAREATLRDAAFFVACPCCDERIKITLPLNVAVESAPLADPVRPFHTVRSGHYCMLARRSSSDSLAEAEKQGWTMIELAANRRQTFNPDDVDKRFTLSRRAYSLIYLGAAVVALAMVTLVVKNRTVSSQNAMESPPALNQESTGTQTIAEMARASSQTLERFFAARTPEAKAPFVLNPAEALPAMEAYYADGKEDRGFNAVDFISAPELLSSRDLDRRIMCLARASIAESSQSSSLLDPAALARLPVAREPDSQLYYFRDGKLDWPIFLQHATRSLHRFFQSTDAAPATFRAILVREAQSAPNVLIVSVCDICAAKNVVGQIAIDPSSVIGAEVQRSLSVGVPKAATVNLAWTQNAAARWEATFQKLHCWEFLGLTNMPELNLEN